MNSILLKKYETIDQSKVSEKDKKVMEQVKKLTNSFEETDEAKNKVAEKILDQISTLNPDAVKKPKVVAQKVVKAKKVAKAKAPATTSPAKGSGNNIMSVAKEIRKVGETFKDAMERAKQVLKERREQVIEKKKTELEKLLALVKTKKELQGFSKSDIQRDAVRTAKVKGSRFVTKEGTTSNAYGTFPNKLGRKYWETRDRHSDRLAPNYPKDMPLLASGGRVEEVYFFQCDSKEIRDDFFEDLQNYMPDHSKAKMGDLYIQIFADKNDDVNLKQMANSTDGVNFVEEKFAKGGSVTNKKGAIKVGVFSVEDLKTDIFQKALDKKSKETGLTNIDLKVINKGGKTLVELYLIPNKSDSDVKIKDWYTKTYPTDDLGEELDDTVTFEDLWNEDYKERNIYEVIGVGDSVIRERLFEYLAEIKGVSYDVVYRKLFSTDGFYANGGMTDLTMQNVSFAKGGSTEKYKSGQKFYDTRYDRVCEIVPSSYDGLVTWKRYNKSGTEFENETQHSLVENQFDYLVDMGAYQISKQSMAKGGNITNEDKLLKELYRLQRELNSGRLSTYREGDNSEEEMARQKEREVKLARFNEVLKTLRESDAKFADGGSLPFMTDPNFGNFQNTGAFANGGSIGDLTEQEYLKKHFSTSVFTENPSQYFEIKKISSDDDAKVSAFIKELKADGFTVKKRAFSDFTSVMGVKKKGSYELGGAFVMTDLAGHTGGSDGLGGQTLLSGVTGTNYTGLVGETGAMSSGEMFARGGGVGDNVLGLKKGDIYKIIDTFHTSSYNTTMSVFTFIDYEDKYGEIVLKSLPFPPNPKKKNDFIYVSDVSSDGIKVLNDEEIGQVISRKYKNFVKSNYEAGGAMMQNQEVINDASQHYVNYYLGQGASNGIYKDGGSIPNNYEGRATGNIWNNWDLSQKLHFLSDHTEEVYGRPAVKGQTNNEINEFFGKLIYEKYDDLPLKTKVALVMHTTRGQYAYGGKTKGGQSMKDLYIEQIASLTGTRTVGIEKFVDDNNLTESELSNLMTGLGRGMVKRSDFTTAISGEKGNAMQKEVIDFAKSDKAFKMVDGGFMNNVYAEGGAINGMLNKKIQKLADVRGFEIGDWATSEYNKIMTQALIESLTDANFHDEAKQVVVKAERKTKWSDDLYQSESFNPDEKVASFAREVARQCDYDGYDIINAYFFITKMAGSKVASMIEDLFLNKKPANSSSKPNKYIDNADIKSVTVNYKGKTVSFKGEDVLNGANLMEKGGDLTKIAFYIAKRDVISVELKNGETIKPVNGYWVKKGSEPINLTSSSPKTKTPAKGKVTSPNYPDVNFNHKVVINGETINLALAKSYVTGLNGSRQYDFIDVEGNPMTGYGFSVKEALKQIEEFGNNPMSYSQTINAPKKIDESKAHFQADALGNVFADSNFVNQSQNNLPNSELKHYGFGDFYLQTPDGNIDFIRTSEEKEGFVGRTHKLKGSNELIKKLVEAMKEKGRFESTQTFADGGDTRMDYMNSPSYKELKDKRDKLYFDVKSRVVIAVGLDSAIEFYDADLKIAPVRFIERAVTGNFILLNEINERLIDSAMDRAMEIDIDEDIEEIGSSDFTYYLKSVLDEAGFKVGFVGSSLKRLNEDGSVKEINNGYFEEGGFMNNVYAHGGEIRRFDRQEQMNAETREEVLDIVSDPDMNGSLTNYLYGLYDGYDYSETAQFKKEISKLKSINEKLYDRINNIYKTIDKYKFEKYDDYAHGGDMNHSDSKDTWQNLLEDYGFKKGKSKYGLDMYYKRGYMASIDKNLRNVDFMFEDEVIYKGYSVQGLMNSLEGEFGKRKMANGGSFADGGMFDNNNGFMRADNENNYRYPETDIEVDVLDEPIDLTDNTSNMSNEVVIMPLNEDINLNEDGRVRARMSSNPMNRNPNKMMAVNQRMVITDFPMTQSNTHKND